MKITICGSIVFYDEMLAASKELERLGHEVEIPHDQVYDEKGDKVPLNTFHELCRTGNTPAWAWRIKHQSFFDHFRKIEWSDVIMVFNQEKKGVAGYIGGNTLIEMGLALYLNKPIYLYYAAPDLSYHEEIVGMQPIIINGDLTKII